MSSPSLRALALALACLAAGAAVAETYTAQVYSVPLGYTRMYIHGAGDNAMMTGYLTSGISGSEVAAYRTSGGFKVIHPTLWHNSLITDSWGSTYHCGYGRPNSAPENHALFWVGGGPATDLHPAGAEYNSSFTQGGGGQLQVGTVNGDINCQECGIAVEGHAGVWNRTAASFKRLHSLTHKETSAIGTDGTKIVGLGFHRGDNSGNAILWNTTTSMGINIRPSGSTESIANSVWGNQQGGAYRSMATQGEQHACVWAGTAASALDVNPNAVFKSSVIVAVRNGLQVGNARPIGNPTRPQAIAWHGTAASWINLHSKLPVMFHTWHSYAEGIDNLGNVTGYVRKPDGTDVRPVVWIRS